MPALEKHRLLRNPKSEIRNPKSEIRNLNVINNSHYNIEEYKALARDLEKYANVRTSRAINFKKEILHNAIVA